MIHVHRLGESVDLETEVEGGRAIFKLLEVIEFQEAMMTGKLVGLLVRNIQQLFQRNYCLNLLDLSIIKR